MAQKNKWVEVTSAGEPVEDVARRVLATRLDFVWRYLDLAAEEPISETQNVHQLRVSTRRAMAALKTFAAFCPKRRAQWIKKQLKQVRRAAGDARDLDVLLGRLVSLSERRGDNRYDPLIAEVRSRRKEAQGPVVAICEKLEDKNFSRRARALLKRVRLRSKDDRRTKPGFEQVARSAMQPIIDQFFGAAAADLHSPEALHAFRIQAKRLRYAMEIFAGAFEEFRTELYPQVETLQEKLGDINDHVTAGARFEKWLADASDPELRTALEEMRDFEKAELATSRDRFFQWWTPERARELRCKLESAIGGQGCATRTAAAV